MPAKKKQDILDIYVRQVADAESRRSWWKVDPIARQAVAMLQPVPTIKGLDLTEILVRVAKDRARKYLASATDKEGLRKYETVADGSQGRRWRKVTEMTADDFDRVLVDYRKKRRGLDRVISVYEDFRDTLRLHEGERVSDVYEEVIARQKAQGNL